MCIRDSLLAAPKGLSGEALYRYFYDADVAELKERMADVWELLKVQQRNEL